MVEWLNNNAGAIQAVTTVVLVAVTTWYVALTRQMVQATRTSQRPYVYFDVTSEGPGSLEFGVGNYGERAAERVGFNVLRQPTQRDGKPIADGTPLERGIRYLPPGRGYRFMVFMSDEVYSGPADRHVLDVEVTYAYGGTKYSDRWTIDFADFEGILLKSFRDSGDEIARSVMELAREAQRRSSQDRFRSIVPQALRQCPSCAELVHADARKCRHCLEWLPEDASLADEVAPTSELGDIETSPAPHEPDTSPGAKEGPPSSD